MSDDSLQYLPEQFRTSGGVHHEAADGAEDLSRRMKSVTASASQFGGAGAATFSAALTSAASDRGEMAQRAAEDRTAIGEGAVAAASHGEEADAAAHTFLTVTTTDVSRGIADSI
ncbi:hypothetical protein ACFV5N_20455 [Streptomyces sp. NPDC059853]|uniref:hypothetical protein n=1 Tax=Streptomyces sp. NPDC059853 TaxID=3346973 RepID=UPI0036632DD1